MFGSWSTALVRLTLATLMRWRRDLRVSIVIGVISIVPDFRSLFAFFNCFGTVNSKGGTGSAFGTPVTDAKSHFNQLRIVVPDIAHVSSWDG